MTRLLCSVGFALVCMGWQQCYTQQRTFTVRDDIEMVRFNEPSATSKGSTAKFSPDRKYFVVVTSRGLLPSDEIESTLSIYRTGESERYINAPEASAILPRPQTTVSMKAIPTTRQNSPYAAVISDIRWSPDSRELYFIAERPNESRRIYTLNVKSGRSVPLTSPEYHVLWFDISANTLAYSAWRSTPKSKTGKIYDDSRSADARVVTGESLRNIFKSNNQTVPTDRELWIVHDIHGHRKATPVSCASQRDMNFFGEAFSLSPSGHKLIQLQPVASVSTGWARYEPAKGFAYLRIHPGDPDIMAATNAARLKQYALVDLDRGNSTTLIDAPLSFPLGYGGGSASRGVWSASERRVLLTNTLLPLNDIDEAEPMKRLKPCAVAEVEIPSRRTHCVAFTSDIPNGPVEELAFGANDNEVAFTVRKANSAPEKMRYLFQDGRWTLVADQVLDATVFASKESLLQLKVFVKQGLNEPPTLWMTDTRTEISKMLLDPNPQFSRLMFGEALVYRWRDPSGYEWKGGLVKPVNYESGKRYPLVIQIYNFNENEFLTDGMMPTAFAARGLASAGIMVLQIQRRLPHTFNPAEADAQLAGMQSAVEHLFEEGLVDSKKVGVVGFSASAWYVENALIKAPTLFAAATIADGIDFSYMQYRLWGVSDPSFRREIETTIGTEPSGDGLKQWFKFAPGFQLGHVATPLRIEAMLPISLLMEWELYSSLREQNKPVDLIYFPEGQHIHQKPCERLASQQGDVDWFRFWLLGHEDVDKSKRSQYERWEKMENLIVPIWNDRSGITGVKTQMRQNDTKICS